MIPVDGLPPDAQHSSGGIRACSLHPDAFRAA
jgi:hypothetical protein